MLRIGVNFLLLEKATVVLFLSLCEGLKLLFLRFSSSVLYLFNPKYRRLGKTFIFTFIYTVNL